MQPPTKEQEKRIKVRMILESLDIDEVFAQAENVLKNNSKNVTIIENPDNDLVQICVNEEVKFNGNYSDFDLCDLEDLLRALEVEVKLETGEVKY